MNDSFRRPKTTARSAGLGSGGPPRECPARALVRAQQVKQPATVGRLSLCLPRSSHRHGGAWSAEALDGAVMDHVICPVESYVSCSTSTSDNGAAVLSHADRDRDAPSSGDEGH